MKVQPFSRDWRSTHEFGDKDRIPRSIAQHLQTAKENKQLEDVANKAANLAFKWLEIGS